MYDPLYAKIQELGVPIAAHGSRHVAEPFMNPRMFPPTTLRFHAMVHPVQQMKAMSDWICGGVLERFPRLKLAFLESGVGWMPYFIDRLDEDYEKMGEDEPLMTRRPSEYLLSGQCYFACDPDEELIPWAAERLGENQIIYASDYPHFDCRFPDSVRLIDDRHDMSEGLKRKVLSENAKDLYGL